MKNGWFCFVFLFRVECKEKIRISYVPMGLNRILKCLKSRYSLEIKIYITKLSKDLKKKLAAGVLGRHRFPMLSSFKAL